MKKIFALIALLIIVFGCRSRKQIIHHTTTDSTRIEYRTIEKEILRDTTIYVALPAEVKEVVQQDSSYLQNTYATSFAIVRADGLLFHSLSSKPQPIAVPVSIKDTHTRKDSIVYRNKIQLEQVPVKMPLKRWQKILMYLGALFLILAAIAIGVGIKRVFF